MDPKQRAVMERWAQQPSPKTNQRQALVQSVLLGKETFEKARPEVEEQERKEFIDLVRDGKKEPKEAEEEAARLGCGPLIPVLDEVRLDPMRETYWTLHMALAWIMWRTAGDVRRHWGAWRAEKKNWRPNGDYGHSASSMEPASYDELRHDELVTQTAQGNVPIVPSDNARFELWCALEGGALIASGIDVRTNKRIEIPAHEFIDLNLDGSEDGLFMRRGGPAAYLKLRLKSAEIQRAWQSPAIEVSHDVRGPKNAVGPKHNPKKGRGRKAGDGSYDAIDFKVLHRMKSLIEGGRAASPNEAAGMLEARTRGQSPEARRDRLQRKYKKWEEQGFPEQ